MRLRPVEMSADQFPGGIGTTATDGTHLFYDPEFIAKQGPEVLKGLLVHEVMHCAMGHLWRRDGRDPMQWNIACDIAINQIIRASGIRLPPTELEKEEADYPNMSAEDIYARHKREQKKGGKGAACGGMIEPKQGEPGSGDKEGEGEGFSPSSGLKSEADWRIAIEIAAKGQPPGKLPAAIQRLIENLHESKVDWRTTLRRFVARVVPSDYSWVQPNRRFIAQGLILPGIVKDGVPRLGLCVDTSGSIGGDLLTDFASELTAILEECKPECMETVFCDAAVANVVVYQPGDMVDLAHDAKGGGGTAFEPALNYFTNHEQGPPVAVIYLTDGFANVVEEEPPYPVIWAICPHGRNSQKFGEEVNIG